MIAPAACSPGHWAFLACSFVLILLEMTNFADSANCSSSADICRPGLCQNQGSSFICRWPRYAWRGCYIFTHPGISLQIPSLKTYQLSEVASRQLKVNGKTSPGRCALLCYEKGNFLLAGIVANTCFCGNRLTDPNAHIDVTQVNGCGDVCAGYTASRYNLPACGRNSTSTSQARLAIYSLYRLPVVNVTARALPPSLQQGAQVTLACKMNTFLNSSSFPPTRTAALPWTVPRITYTWTHYGKQVATVTTSANEFHTIISASGERAGWYECTVTIPEVEEEFGLPRSANARTFLHIKNFCPVLEAPENGYLHANTFTVNTVVQFNCSLGYRLEGDANLLCLSSGRWNGSTPICSLIGCGSPKFPANARHKRTSHHFEYNSTVSYTCLENFYMIGGNNITCLPSGKWSAGPPACLYFNCSRPFHPVNGRFTASNSSGFVAVDFECDLGHQLNGSKKLLCSHTGIWIGNFPICSLVTCPQLKIDDGKVNVTAMTYGGQANINCDLGFELRGPNTLTCTHQGNWSKTHPTCARITCLELSDPANGRKNGTHSDYASVVTFSCVDGFELAGSSKRTCLLNKRWSGENATCRPVPCPSLTHPLNGNITTGKMNYTFGENAAFSCKIGYKLTGKQSLRCEASGRWSAEVPECTLVTCPQINYPEGGSLTNDNVTYQSIVEFKCDRGYLLNGSQALYCQATGMWNATTPQCQLVTCPNVSAPVEGQMNGTTFAFNNSLYFSCNHGYNLNGTNVLTCLENGMWDGSRPICLPVNCGHPVSPTHGTISGSSFVYPNTVLIDCSPGYELNGSRVLQCGANGAWDEDVPQCQPVSCQPLKPPTNGSVRSLGNTFNSTAVFECDNGFIINGSSSVICNENATWLPQEPICLPVDCKNPGTPINGITVYSNSFTFTGKVILACHRGYKLIGSAALSCQADGNWTEDLPHCVPKDCGKPEQPHNGNLHGRAFTVNETVTFSCDNGYFLQGASVLTCEDTGLWNDSTPSCPPMSCGGLSQPSNGRLAVGSTTFGNVAVYSCDHGYNLNGSSVLECTADGEWNSSTPRCAPVQCDLPKIPPNGSIKNWPITGGYFFHDIAVFSCDYGFALSGSPVLECMGHGWNASEPHCSIVTCRNLTVTEHGYMDSTSNTFQSNAAFSCQDGYLLSDTSPLVCQANGSWNGTEPSCTPVPCPQLAEPSNGHFAEGRNATSFPGKINVVCKTGFTSADVKSLTCTSNGTWSSDLPSCIPVLCPDIEDIANGSVTPEGNFTYSTMVNISCQAGFEVIGPNTAVCQADGSWDRAKVRHTRCAQREPSSTASSATSKSPPGTKSSRSYAVVVVPSVTVGALIIVAGGLVLYITVKKRNLKSSFGKDPMAKCKRGTFESSKKQVVGNGVQWVYDEMEMQRVPVVTPDSHLTKNLGNSFPSHTNSSRNFSGGSKSHLLSLPMADKDNASVRSASLTMQTSLDVEEEDDLQGVEEMLSVGLPITERPNAVADTTQINDALGNINQKIGTIYNQLVHGSGITKDGAEIKENPSVIYTSLDHNCGEESKPDVGNRFAALESSGVGAYTNLRSTHLPDTSEGGDHGKLQLSPSLSRKSHESSRKSSQRSISGPRLLEVDRMDMIYTNGTAAADEVDGVGRYAVPHTQSQSTENLREDGQSYLQPGHVARSRGPFEKQAAKLSSELMAVATPPRPSRRWHSSTPQGRTTAPYDLPDKVHLQMQSVQKSFNSSSRSDQPARKPSNEKMKSNVVGVQTHTISEKFAYEEPQMRTAAKKSPGREIFRKKPATSEGSVFPLYDRADIFTKESEKIKTTESPGRMTHTTDTALNGAHVATGGDVSGGVSNSQPNDTPKMPYAVVPSKFPVNGSQASKDATLHPGKQLINNGVKPTVGNAPSMGEASQAAGPVNSPIKSRGREDDKGTANLDTEDATETVAHLKAVVKGSQQRSSSSLPRTISATDTERMSENDSVGYERLEDVLKKMRGESDSESLNPYAAVPSLGIVAIGADNVTQKVESKPSEEKSSADSDDLPTAPHEIEKPYAQRKLIAFKGARGKGDQVDVKTESKATGMGDLLHDQTESKVDKTVPDTAVETCTITTEEEETTIEIRTVAGGPQDPAYARINVRKKSWRRKDSDDDSEMTLSRTGSAKSETVRSDVGISEEVREKSLSLDAESSYKSKKFSLELTESCGSDVLSSEKRNLVDFRSRTLPVYSQNAPVSDITARIAKDTPVMARQNESPQTTPLLPRRTAGSLVLERALSGLASSGPE